MSRMSTFLERSTPDLVSGQEVIVAARWVLVVAAMLFALWLPADLPQLRVEAFLILLLAMGNFFLHAQVLRRKPAADWAVYAASAGDLIAITTLLVMQGGLRSDLYVFYFPAVLAYSVAFASRYTVAYTVLAVAGYAATCWVSATTEAEVLTVAVRCLMIVAVATCGNQYRRMEHSRAQRIPGSAAGARA